MTKIAEVSEVYHSHHYHISIKTATWATALVILAMALLYPILSFPPTFGSYYSDMYFHSIGLSMLSLVICLVLLFYDLQRWEPPIDFPLHYRALITSLLAAASGIFFLTPALSSIPQIPTILFVLAALFAIDITGAAFIELLFLPRKLGGTYDLKLLSNLSYFEKWKVFLFKRADIAAYSKADSAYWLVLAGLGSLFIGEIIGLVLLWIMLFGAGIFAPYVNSLGGVQSTVQSIIDPHSHGVAVAIMAIVIGLAVQRFGTLSAKGWKRLLTKFGMWLSVVSLIALTLVYVAGAFAAYSPPTLFQSGPSGINGMAGDDALITLVFMGVVLALVPLALTSFRGKSSWHDSIRFALLFVLLMWLVANAVAGFYIEFNESSFSASLSSNDAAFSQFQPMFGIFFLTITAMVLLAADYYGSDSRERRNSGLLAGAGVAIATIGGLGWVFIDPAASSYFFWGYILGILLVCVSILFSVRVIYKAKISRTRIVRK